MCSADTTFSFMKCLLFYRIAYCVIELEVEFDIGKVKENILLCEGSFIVEHHRRTRK